jgi:outer membrane receptor protein involved in Fe transport
MLALGGRYDDAASEDLFVGGIFGPSERVASGQRGWSPQIGARWQIDRVSAVRAAAFRTRNLHDRAALSPALLAGFALRRSEPVGTRRDEVAVAYERTDSPGRFLSVSGYRRSVHTPAYRLDADLELERFLGRHSTTGAQVEVNWRLGRRWTFSSETQARRIVTDVFRQADVQSRLGARWISPGGWHVSLAETFLRQRYDEDLPAFALPQSTIWLTDVAVQKELPAKRGRFGLNVSNLFDEDFNVAIEGLSVVQRLPARQAVAFFEWVF